MMDPAEYYKKYHTDRESEDVEVYEPPRRRGRRSTCNGDDCYEDEPRPRRGRKSRECEDGSCGCSVNDEIDDFAGCTGPGKSAEDWIDRMLDF